MVWVLTNKDRDSRLEIQCSVPTVYRLNLTSNAMRNATAEVLKMCYEKSLKILTIHTDGQWIKLMTRDSFENTLTVHQLTKDACKTVQKMSKKEIIHNISEISRVKYDHLKLLQADKSKA
jgi:phosphoribosylformylglycinamidine (FGAM) synthase PurS component